MILRRITKHVKVKNWFAVALDFFIVVVGILIAFQITNWNEARSERARSQDYRTRIRADLVADMSELKKHSEYWEKITIEGNVAIKYAETGELNGATEWEVLRSFLHASQSWQFSFVDTIYSELRSTGDWGLIPDADLRNAFADYYVKVADRRGGSGHYHLLPEYRKLLRGRMRSDIMRYYWKACFKQSAGVQELIDCFPPPGFLGTDKILEQLAADQLIVDALRYWIDTQTMAVELTGIDLGRARSLIDYLDGLT